jgi:thimet oligopeptidase
MYANTMKMHSHMRSHQPAGLSTSMSVGINLLFSLCLGASSLAWAAAPTDGSSGSRHAHPLLPIYDAETINQRCDAELAAARKSQAAMERRKSPAGLLDEWNKLSIQVENWTGPVDMEANVNTDGKVRDAADACILKFSPFKTDLFQSEPIYKRLQAFKPANHVQSALKKQLEEGFEDSGITLDKDKRARLKAINERINDLSQQFAKNLRDDPTRVTFTSAEMEGMPEAYLKSHESKRDAQGNYVLDLSYPSYVPFLQSARNEDARKRYWLAKQNEGGDTNLKLLDEVVALRRELAGLYGMPDFATYQLSRRMVGNAATVYKFLDEVKSTVADLEKSELGELRAFKAKATQQALEQTVLNRWDLSYYQEALKKSRFNVDQEALRAYFPTDKSVRFALRLAETLYGIRFEEVKVRTWHDDVRYFDVYEAGSKTGRGKFIGGIYLDLYPRDGKYGHAAAFGQRSESTLAHRSPITVLVTNFNRVGLDHDELETLLHEFGHVLHGVLSKAAYVDQAGTNVKLDFVEAPSQMFEEWARRPEPLGLFKQVCPECPQLNAEQLAQLDASRKFGRGIRYARQWLYAAFDMALTTPAPDPALATWARLEGATPLGHVAGSKFPAGFGHLVGGYAAGYYGYMWSEVLALDMLSGFEGHMLDPKVGMRYRNAVLAKGGERPPLELVESFLHRKPTSDAFFKEIVGKR